MAEKRNTLTDGAGMTRPDDAKMVKMPLPESRGEIPAPAPIKVPESLADKMREKLQVFKEAERDFNTSLKAYVEGFMCTQPPTPPGYNTHVDPENGVIFFLKAQEQPLSE